MNDARDEILGRIRSAVASGRPDEARADAEARLRDHPRNLIPARAKNLGDEARENLFAAMAEEADATVTRVGRCR